MGLLGGLVDGLLGDGDGDGGTATVTSTTEATSTGSSGNGNGSGKDKSSKGDSQDDDTTTSTAATTSSTTSSAAAKQTVATSSTATATTSLSSTTSQSATSTTASNTPSSTSSASSSSTDSATGSSSDTLTGTAQDDTNPATAQSLVTASASLSSAASSTNTTSTSSSISANVQNAAVKTDSNIFNPDNKLFPLGIVVAIIAGLFFIVVVTVLLVRFCGFTKRSRLRNRAAHMSFTPVTDPRFDPRSSMHSEKFETITTNMRDVERGFNPVASTTNLVNRPPSWGSDASMPPQRAGRPTYERGYIEPYAAPGRQMEAGYAGVGAQTYGAYDGAFFPDGAAQPPGQYGFHLGVSQGASEGGPDMGSPVPSFLTGKMDNQIQQPGQQYRGFVPPAQPAPMGIPVRQGSEGARWMGENPSSSGARNLFGTGGLARKPSDGRSFRSTSSASSEGHHRLGKGRGLPDER